MRREILVVLDPSQTEGTLTALREAAQLIQSLPPRLALVRGESAAIAALPGVASVHDSAATDIPADLTELEKLFVEAWRTRSADAPKQRSADGLPWDAPGFEPPDPPDGHG